MKPWLSTALGGCGCAALLSVVFAVYDLHQTQGQTRGTLGKLNDTLDALSAPCKEFQGDYVCGPIAQLSQTEKNVGILAARSAQQVQQTSTLINAASTAMSRASDDIRSLAAHGDRTLSSLDRVGPAATQSAQALTVDLGTLNQSLTALADPQNGIPANLAEAHKAVGDLDALVTNPDVTRAIKGTADTAQNVAVVTDNTAKVTTHFEQEIDTPKPKHWYSGIKAAWGVTWQVLMLIK